MPAAPFFLFRHHGDPTHPDLERKTMTGLASMEMALAFWMSIGSCLLCVGYGIWKWNDAGTPDRVTVPVEKSK